MYITMYVTIYGTIFHEVLRRVTISRLWPPPENRSSASRQAHAHTFTHGKMQLLNLFVELAFCCSVPHSHTVL